MTCILQLQKPTQNITFPHTKMGYNSLKKVFLTTKKETIVEELLDDAKFDI